MATDIYNIKIGNSTYNLPFLRLSGGTLTGQLNIKNNPSNTHRGFLRAILPTGTTNNYGCLHIGANVGDAEPVGITLSGQQPRTVSNDSSTAYQMCAVGLGKEYTYDELKDIVRYPQGDPLYRLEKCRVVVYGNMFMDGGKLLGTAESADTASYATNLGTSSSYYTKSSLDTALNGKQATISDLATIRSNATNGNTAYGWGNHADAGYIDGISKDMVTSALGYTPYSNAGGTITGTATVKGTLKIYDGTNVATLKMDQSSLSIDKELKLTAGGTADISPNIKAAIKAKVFQASDLICENVYLGTASGNASTLPLKIRKYTNTTGNVPVSGDSDVLVTIGTDGKVTAGGFIGSLTGTASYATNLGTSSSYYTKSSLDTALNGKQATISDLATIRSNAANGNTAYGWGNHANAGYITASGSITGSAGSATIWSPAANISDCNAVTDSRLVRVNSSAANVPSNWTSSDANGGLVTFNTWPYMLQLFISRNNSTRVGKTEPGAIYIRKKAYAGRDTSTNEEIYTWDPWREIIHSGNIGNYASTSSSSIDQVARDAAAAAQTTANAAQTTANGKWTWNENTIKAVKVNKAAAIDNFESTNGGNPVDCNATGTNGLRYYSSNGPEYKAGFADASDGSLYTQAFSDVWVTQIAQGFREGRLFTRCKNNGAWQSWKKVAYEGDAPAAHTHNYLPLSGGTLTGEVSFNISGLAQSDICSGIIAAFKASRIQATDLVCETITLGSTGSASNKSLTIRKYGSISNTNPASTTNLVTVNTSGQVSALGGFFETSDERLKDFGEDIQVDLNKLKSLKKKYFKFKGSDKIDLGVSAQEIQEIYPEIVLEDENGTLQVDYAKLSVIALKAIDILQEDTDKRLKKIEALLNL